MSSPDLGGSSLGTCERVHDEPSVALWMDGLSRCTIDVVYDLCVLGVHKLSSGKSDVGRVVRSAVTVERPWNVSYFYHA